MARATPTFVVHVSLVTLLALQMLTTHAAFAALGQPEASVQADREQLSASDRVTARSHFSIHEMSLPAGTTVRQFVSTAGSVFAVSWEGSAPDLRQLLGSHYDEYVAAVQAMPGRRGRGVHIDTGDLVVETGGHMGYVIGRAYLRSQMPPEVKVHEIR